MSKLLKKRPKALTKRLLLNYSQKPKKTLWWKNCTPYLHILMANLTKPLGLSHYWVSFHWNTLTDVAHAYKKSEQPYKGTCKIALIFRGRPRSANWKAKGGKAQSAKWSLSEQLWRSDNCLSEFFYSHFDEITLKQVMRKWFRYDENVF